MPCQLIKINKLTQQIFYFIFFVIFKNFINTNLKPNLTIVTLAGGLKHQSKTQSHSRDSTRLCHQCPPIS